MKILKFILTIISISIILSQNIKSIFIPVDISNLDIICLNKDNTGEFIYDPNQVGIVGIGGTFTFRFKVNSHNNNFKTIKLIYKRDWENNPNDLIVSINVLVIE